VFFGERRSADQQKQITELKGRIANLRDELEEINQKLEKSKK
jgi:uncharacterized coiled-coil protein SlyX